MLNRLKKQAGMFIGFTLRPIFLLILVTAGLVPESWPEWLILAAGLKASILPNFAAALTIQTYKRVLVMKIIADALHFNSFKKIWSARVSLMDGDRCSGGIQIEAKTKKAAYNQAKAAMLELSADHLCGYEFQI